MFVVFLILLVAALGTALYHVIKVSQFRMEIMQLREELRGMGAKHEQEKNQWKGFASSLKAKVDTLSKYQGIVDAEAKAAEILRNAGMESQRVIAEAEAIGAEARSQALLLTAKARTDAAIVVAKANEETKEIREQAALYEKTAKAMKHTIEGYGDEFIIPGHSLLDDLAEEFGHKEAGEELKKARERTKNMVRVGAAASCDYVEANRHDTAINFVVDAFNGKVDSILSRVKSDNAGTLAHEMRDAFALVNYNGQAFRSARITDEYLAARLDELKWGAIAQQLKLEEREEQRVIQEQMREEERARREYERAMREAARDEDALRRAREKVQQQIEQASSEQKAKYEQQLAELTQKLKEVEERGRRAKSMAEQTRKGHVYIISNIGSFGEDVYKIGLTRRIYPEDRVYELGDSSVPFEFDVHAMIQSDDAPALEALLHRSFVMRQVNKVNHRKEFFRANLGDIQAEVEKMGLNVKWTLAAEAREYRETLALEKSLEKNPALKEDWIQRELAKEHVHTEVIPDGEVDAGSRSVEQEN